MKKEFYPHQRSQMMKVRPSFVTVGLVWLIVQFGLINPLNAQSKFGDSTGIGTTTPMERLEILGQNPVIFLNPSNWNLGAYGELRLGDVNHYIRGTYDQGMIFKEYSNFKFQGGTNAFLSLTPSNWNTNGDYAELRLGGGNHHIRGVFGEGMKFHDTNGFEFKGMDNLSLLLKSSNWSQSGDYAEIKFGDDNHYIKAIHSSGMLFNDVNGFSFMTTNKFGIGTQYPQAKFHVVGVDNTADGKNAAIEIANAAAPGGAWMMRVGANGTTTPVGGLSFANNSRYVMSLTESGNVGIGTLNPQKALHVQAGSNDHIALFENTSGGDADGIAIKLNEVKDNIGTDNQFVSFLRGDNSLAGRIEGYQYDNSAIVAMIQDLLYVMGVDGNQTFTDLTNLSGPTAKDEVLNILNGNSLPFNVPGFSPGSFPSISWGSLSGGSLPWVNFGSLGNQTDLIKAVLPTGDMTAIANGTLNVSQLKTRLQQKSSVLQGYLSENPAILDLITAGDPWGLALAAMTIEVLAWAQDDGVSYASKGADYAEWLPKADSTEQFVFGQIVGVKDGKITKSTMEADQMMVISQNPIVLGNMVAKEEEDKYEKVGFMGQVPVHVIGKVETGDYIIASGLDNGFGKAVSPEAIKLEHFTKIVGRAWSENDLPLGVVNVAIGLKTNEWVKLFKEQQNALAQLEKELGQMKSDRTQLLTSFETLKAEVNGLALRIKTSKDQSQHSEKAAAKIITKEQ